MQNAIHQHCAELERCNQRGGRMLSVFDLLKAGTLDLDLAAYFLARISRGASFMWARTLEGPERRRSCAPY
jgi:hypothetical protein